MAVGQTVGRYRIAARIGVGGMGEVYRATMQTVGGVDKPVALKVVHPRLVNDKDFEALFVGEAKVAMSLSHANVVTAFDVGRIDDRWFIAMEHVDGIDLAALLATCARIRQPIPHRHAILVAVEALKGLDYAHRKKSAHGEPLSIVHRDVSPGNLLISFEGEVKVADFGIAKSTLKDGASIAGEVKGKLPYMAPEQLRGEAVDRRADLYSVGAVLYEMLTGRRVVQNDYASAIPVVLGGQFPPPREITNEVSEELESIVLRALRTTPGDRFPSAAAMRQELERHAMQRGFLLSTTDLSDFVRTVMGVGTTRLGGATLRAAESARPNDLSFAPTELAVDMTPPKNDTGAAFDALLGMQLSPVETSAPFSVYRTAESPEVSVPAAPASSPRWSSESADDGVVPALRSDPVDADPLRLPAPSRAPLYFALALALVAVVGMMGLSWMAGDADTQTNAITETAVEPEPAASGTAAGATAETEARPTAETEVTVTDSGSPTSATTETDPEETQTAATAETEPAPRPHMRPPSPPTPVGTATLDINTNPWSTVFLDGRPIGSTPIQGHEVPAGRHVLRFENPALGVPETLVVDLEPGARRRVVQDLR